MHTPLGHCGARALAVEQSWFRKRKRLTDALAAIQADMAAQPFKFADEMAKGEPGLDRGVLTIEGLSFFLFSLRWIASQSGEDRLRRRLYDPVADRMCNVLGEMIGRAARGASPGRAKQIVEETADARAAIYKQAPTLLGADANDENCALHAASLVIARSLGRADDLDLQASIKRALLLRLEKLKLPDRVRQFETLLE